MSKSKYAAPWKIEIAKKYLSEEGSYASYRSVWDRRKDIKELGASISVTR